MEQTTPLKPAADAASAPSQPVQSSWRTALTAVAIFTACLAIYHLNGRPQPEVDCVASPYTAWSLVRHGTLDVSSYPELQSLRPWVCRLPDGECIATRPLGAALSAVPIVAPAALFCERPPSSTLMLHLGKLVGAAYSAGTVVVFFFLCRRLAPTAAWPATVLLALGTSLWSVASQALWMHGPATFWVCCAMALLAPEAGGRGGRRGLAAGAALGLAILTRPSTALFAAASGAYCLWRRRWREAAGLLAGAAAPVGLYCLHNFWYFGNPVAGGYVDDNWGQATPLWLGFPGLLIAPSRGLLIYSPALLIAVMGLWRLLRTPAQRSTGRRGMLFAWTVAAALTTAFYARWYDWRGGWCFGPRFLCEMLPLGCLLFGIGFAALRRPWPKRAAAGLVALSVCIHFVGVFGHGAHVDWCERHQQNDQGRSLFVLRDTEIEAHARSVLRRLGVLAKR
jgi:hypothetical protein